MSKKRRKKLTRKKKFLIIASIYIAVFVLTFVITTTTLAWFHGSTWQSNDIYMGGPVYLYFSDAEGVEKTSGANQLVTELPPGYNRLYPGMNLHFEASCVVEGHAFEHTRENGEELIIYTTGAVLRARIDVDVFDADGNEGTQVAQDLYDEIWTQLKTKAASSDSDTVGKWIYDPRPVEEHPTEEDNYFYYIEREQTHATPGEYLLQEVGGDEENVVVKFLSNIVITLNGVYFTNAHADCSVRFTVIFEGLQAYFPYQAADVGTPWQNDNSGRLVTYADVGLSKPLTINNGRPLFEEALVFMYEDMNTNTP